MKAELTISSARMKMMCGLAALTTGNTKTTLKIVMNTFLPICESEMRNEANIEFTSCRLQLLPVNQILGSIPTISTGSFSLHE